MIAHNPLHGSGRAAFPHPALALGNDAHAAQGIRMTNAGGRQPAGDQAPHPIPKNAAVLAAPRKSAVPEPTHLEPKRTQRRAVRGHPVVANVSTHDRTQPLAHFRNGIMHASFEFGFHLTQLRLQPFANRLPQPKPGGFHALRIGRSGSMNANPFFSAVIAAGAASSVQPFATTPLVE
jgi:hypothetical protein